MFFFFKSYEYTHVHVFVWFLILHFDLKFYKYLYFDEMSKKLREKTPENNGMK